MHAVTFEITLPSFLIGKGLGGVTESAIFGGLSRVRYRDVEEPPLPGDDWVRLEVLEAGICGTDIGTLTFKSSPILEPFGSFPAVLGHEVLARVSEVGPAVRRVEPGQRVAVDPIDLRHDALIEPLSIGMHAALNVRPFGDGAALVIGSGPIALGVIWSLRAAGFRGGLVAQVKRLHEADIAKSLGASLVVSPGDEARQALIETGARGYKPIIGDEVHAGGGFPLIFDCVGSGQSLTQCLSYAAPRAKIVMLGCAAEIPKLDLSFLWARELEVKGFLGYSLEDWRDGRSHTFQITHDMLVETGAPVEAMVTHVFPLREYRNALSAAANRRQSGSIKVLLEPAG